MSTSGYCRFPTIHGDVVAFVCEDDLWSVAASGGVARRLTAGLAECMRPRFSPDGAELAFTGREEGSPEVYAMPAEGGPARRLTYLGSTVCLVVGWLGDDVLFASDYGQPFLTKSSTIRAVPAKGGESRSLGLGSAMAISHGAGGRVVLGRNTLDIARWKRYRGGTAGNLWVDAEGRGDFRPLRPHLDGQPIRGNVASPLWVGDRVYFVSDHEGVGNLYSCRPDGDGLVRHTDHGDFYARNPSTDGRSIVYHAGGDLFRLDVASDRAERIEVELHSPRTQRRRKFVDAARYLEDYALHPDGHSVAVVARAQSFAMPCWEQAVTALWAEGAEHGAARYRLTQWLADRKRLVTVCDALGEESLQVHEAGGAMVARWSDPAIGRVVELEASPVGPVVALRNHRYDVVLVDLTTGAARVVARCGFDPAVGPAMGLAWSPDGRYLAYGQMQSIVTSVIEVVDVETGVARAVTRPVLRDHAPCFDPGGRYLYFLSQRVFNPVYDTLDFDMNFPRGMRPYCIALRGDLPSPFVPVPKTSAELRAERKKELVGDGAGPAKRVDIDFDGIEDRVVAFPVAEDRYAQLAATADRVFFTTLPVSPALGSPSEGPPPATLHSYDLHALEQKTVATGVASFKLAPAGVLAYRSDAPGKGARLRVVDAERSGDEARDEGGSKAAEHSRESGYVDLSRVKILVEPPAEWRQMYAEAWRLQRDNFWSEDMQGVDWRGVYERYLPLVDRVASRSEFSDLTWEMQGELGTSHCYEMGGDYRPEPAYVQGLLGADYAWDESTGEWRVDQVVRGDSWDPDRESPLRSLGANVRPGDVLVAVNGRRLGRTSPREALWNLGGQNVALTVKSQGAERTVVVQALKTESPLRYRAWVEANRARVHAATDGRVGYVHVPNMVGLGMSEFFRGFLAEAIRDALIVDVRYNGGGHTSQLILEKLARKRLAYSQSRWGAPQPYFQNAVLGPIVAITNEFAGSDGDIFSHSFKLLGLGTLVGKRTWGGVVGIWPRHRLADGTVTTQPEFSTWFHDVGFGVENYGTDPDVEVDIAPQDWRAGRDPQLARALELVVDQLSTAPKVPSFAERPSLALPALPPRAR